MGLCAYARASRHAGAKLIEGPGQLTCVGAPTLQARDRTLPALHVRHSLPGTGRLVCRTPRYSSMPPNPFAPDLPRLTAVAAGAGGDTDER